MLGGLEVVRGNVPLDLPPSKKTRGLLAYLALSERALRREQLCELLWEIPDDPRGSLRWSLSKIRKLVDDEERQRIVADRQTVAFDASDVAIDLHRLHAAAAAPDELSTGDLEAAARELQGGFLDGLDLPDFQDFHTWCIAERERASRSQASLLQNLVDRLRDAPEQALPHASRLVSLLSYDEQPRAVLIGLLLQLDRRQEAEQQYRLGMQKLKESGRRENGSDGAALFRAWRSGQGAGGPARPEEPADPPPRAGAGERDKTLVGRSAEMAIITDLVNRLPGTGTAQALLIRGDPGLGKSRLLQATAALAREIGAGILKASAFESELVRPFAAWNDALRRALPDNPATQLLDGGERISRDQVFSSLCDVLKTATAQGPVVVLFDDVQWCDESSASAMHYVLRMHRREPILVVGAARDREVRDNAAVQQCLRGLRQDGLLRELRLEPMSEEEMQALISSAAPGADAQRLGRECAGNPLLALELARAEQEGGSGHSLSELVQDRMSRLDEAAVTVLHWSAVLAPRITIQSLEQTTGLDREAIDAAIEAAEQQGILHPGERGFRFSHDLIASSIYREISPARRQVMHRRVAERLEVDAALDLALAADLAHHAPKSGDPALAARAMTSAARLCLRFYANDDALDLFQRGLAFAAELGAAERVNQTLELHDVRLTAAPLEDWEAAAEEYIDLAEQALDHGAQAHARLGYQMASYTRWLHGQWSDAHRDSLQAERVSRGSDGEAHILGIAEAAKCLALLERDLSQADAMAMEASSLAARENFRCPALPFAQGILRYYEGRFDAATEFLEDARTIAKSQGDRLGEFLANEYLTVVEIERGDFRAALRRSHTLVDIGERLREGSERPFAVSLQALCQLGLGEGDDALEAALPDLRQEDAKQRLIFLLNRAALLDLEQDRLPSARTRAAEALELAELMERPSEVLLAHVSLARLQQTDAALVARDHLARISDLAATPVAQWARERATRVLQL